MDELNYQKQQIIEYLLGSLPAPEAERFDELSIADDDFADNLNSAEKDLLDGYVRGELDGKTLERFESYYLASPLRRQKVDFAQTLRSYEKKNPAKKAENLISEKANEERKVTESFSPLSFFKSLNSALQWSFAAALLIAVFGGFWIFNQRFSNGGEIAQQIQPSNVEPTKQIGTRQTENSSIETPSVAPSNTEDKFPVNKSGNKTAKTETNVQPTRTPEPKQTIAPPKISIATFVLTPSMRGGGRVETLAIPQKTTDIETSLQLETDDFPVYRVTLTDESGSVNLWRGGKIKATAKGENKYLNAHFPAKILKSKIYTLTVSGVNADGTTEIIGTYPFRSVLK